MLVSVLFLIASLLHGKWCGIPNNRPYLMFITWKFYKQMVRILFLGFPHQHHWLQPSTNGWCSRHLVESHWWPGWSSIDRLWWRTTPDGALGNGWASSSYFQQADPCLKNHFQPGGGKRVSMLESSMWQFHLWVYARVQWLDRSGCRHKTGGPFLA